MNNYAKALSASMLVLLAACSKDQDSAPAASTDTVATPPAVSETPAAPVVASAGSSGTIAVYAMPKALLEDGHCALDGVNGVAPAESVLHPDQDVTFTGWIADVAVQVPTNAALVLRSKAGSYAVPMTAGVERPDVATALSAESLKLSGFNLSTKLTAVAPGKYEAMVVYGPEGNQSSCLFQQTISVAK